MAPLVLLVARAHLVILVLPVQLALLLPLPDLLAQPDLKAVRVWLARLVRRVFRAFRVSKVISVLLVLLGPLVQLALPVIPDLQERLAIQGQLAPLALLVHQVFL